MMRKILARLPYSDVGDGYGGTFFRRHDVLKTRWFSVYLHQFFRSDADRCLHDHPWPFATVILRGGYWEHVFRYPPQAGGPMVCVGSDDERLELSDSVRIWRRAGYVGRYPACHAHCIEIEPGTRPWSLVFVGRKERAWGFWGPAGWVQWMKGRGNPICETEARP